MAVKDHSLDGKIIESARKEFLSKGFQKASLRDIARNAGITTGALYTRYKNKDMLFSGVISAIFTQINKTFEPLKKNYLDFRDCPTAEKMMHAVREEEKVYLDIMFKYYDECVLFFCRSDGSTIQEYLQDMMSKKAEETVDFLQSISKKELDSDGIGFILSMQFYYYRRVLEKGLEKEQAVKCMKTVETFLEAGWKNLFEEILPEN